MNENKGYRTKSGKLVTAEELAKSYKGILDTPTGKIVPVGYTRDGAAMGYFAAGRWWVFASATITGDWVQVYPEGMPLVNGERPYPDEEFIEV